MMEVQRAEKNEKREEEEEEEEEEAAVTSPDSSVTRTPRRALRGRAATRANSAAPTAASSPDANGTQSAPGSGRVLRDRSTRSVPVWRRRDLGAEQEEGEEEEEEGEEETRRRRRAACPRRRRSAEVARDSRAQCGDSKDAAVTRAGSRRAQSRSRTAASRGARGSARVVCKSEPENETACAEENKTPEKKTSTEKKTEVKEDEVLLGEEDPSFTDDPKDQTYEPQAQSEEDEGVSSEEDVPFKDDLNDQSYDPKSGRESQKPRRRAPPRPREKKEKAGEKDKEKEAEVKTEGVETADVKQEVADGAEPPRKRGRRRKDDKSPRLPKRRKKPPVQYVRCEMEGCGTVLAHPRYLQHHIKYQHLMKKKYVCPHPSCGRLFRLQKQLLRHAKHHTDQRDYICEFCARAFKSSHNLAVHRMIHTGEKPLQCEICGFTCRQKASLNWHMKKHDADASYQFSCAICGKKFEKKDSVVAHKAKSHPEVLIAEALAANAGALVGTPPPPAAQVTPVGVGPVMLLDQEQSLHTMQVPVSLALPSADEVKCEADGGGASASNPTSSNQTLHFVSTPVSQQQLSVQASPQIVHMTFTTLSHPTQQLPLLSVTHQLPPSTSSAPSVALLPQITSVAFSANPAPPPPPPQADRKEGGALWEGGTENVGGVWEAGGAGEGHVVTDSLDGTIQHRLL